MDKHTETLEMQQTQRGFNQGYLIAKHQPELYTDLSKSLKKHGENPYSKGFLSGGKQHEIEKNKEMKKAQAKTIDKTKQPQKQKTPTKSTPKPPTRGR